MGPIFNEKVVKKKVCGSREQCTGPTGVKSSLRNTLLKKKKRKRRRTNLSIQTDT